jgi:uncharacterized protein YukJ
MANPPYSGFIVIVRENQDGGNAKVYGYVDVSEGQPIPKGLTALEYSLFSGLDTNKTPPDKYFDRNFTTRTALKTALGQLVDAMFPDTAA